MLKNRIFQHYKGNVPQLSNISFSEFWIIEDNNEPVILWLKVNNSTIAYRIFIDGIYCGIDEYENEFYEIDLDDDIVNAVNYSDKINNYTLQKTSVSDDHEKKEITLTLLFDNDLKVILTSNYEGECKLEWDT